MADSACSRSSEGTTSLPSRETSGRRRSGTRAAIRCRTASSRSDRAIRVDTSASPIRAWNEKPGSSGGRSSTEAIRTSASGIRSYFFRRSLGESDPRRGRRAAALPDRSACATRRLGGDASGGTGAGDRRLHRRGRPDLASRYATARLVFVAESLRVRVGRRFLPPAAFASVAGLHGRVRVVSFRRERLGTA